MTVADATLQISGQKVKVSSLDKTLYPDAGHTKRDVIGYYRDVAEVMLPHLQGRPLTVRRFPDGIADGGFYQKDASAYFPDWISTVEVARRSSEGTVRHVVCDSAATLVYLANQACLEFHIATSTADALDRPDRLIVDLDPADDADVEDVRRVARAVRDLFTELGLTPFLQTTGGKGFHVVAPLDGEADYRLVRPLAHDMAVHLAAEDPDRLTVEHRKANRGGRIFLDTGRNAYGQTAVAPYSLRARPNAPVATPIDWSELGRVKPDSYVLTRMKRRLGQKGDPWSSMDGEQATASHIRRRLDELVSQAGQPPVG